MEEIGKSCNDCACISNTEDEQHEHYLHHLIVDHRCRKFNKKLFHRESKIYKKKYRRRKGEMSKYKELNRVIYPCEECNFKFFTERE